MREEKITIDQFIQELERGGLLYSSPKIKGVSYFDSNLSVLIDKFLSNSKKLFLDNGYVFLQLPVFVKGEDFLNQCKKIKDFSRRVFWGDPLKNGDQHVFNSTIEAQITSLLSKNSKLLSIGNKFAFIRQIGRYESGKTIPFWKERLVSFFVEAQTLHLDREDLDKTIDEMNEILRKTYEYLFIKPFFIERFKDNKRLGEYSERRLESVVMDPSGSFSILSSIYDLGDSFSKAFNLRVEGKYPLMINFAYSARLLLLMLINHSDKTGILYPSVLAESEVRVMYIDDSISQLEKKRTQDYLNAQKVTYKEQRVSHANWKKEFAKLKTKGIPIIIVFKKDGSWVYQRIADKLKKIRKAEDLAGLNIKGMISEHNEILRKRQAKSVDSNIYVYNEAGCDNLLSVKEQIIITGLCNEDRCLNSVKESLKKWDLLGHLLDKNPRVNNCVCCGKKAEFSILLGRKAKTEK